MATTEIVAHLLATADTRALTKADKQFKTFQSTLKSVGRTLGVTLSVGAVVAYSKASVKAASEDAKAQRVLANSLANVGLSFEAIRVENFIANMEKTTGILDDQLRPAFSQLLRVTGSVTKTQELLGVAFDTGAGSTVGFSKAVNILSQVYVGNYKSVKQLNLGLTQQELKTISITKLIDIMKNKFKNAGQESVSALDVLSVGLANVQEQFGYGLTDATQTANDVSNINDLTDAMQKLAYASGRVGGSVLAGVSNAIGRIKDFVTKEGLFKIFGGFGAPGVGQLAPIQKQTKAEKENAKLSKEFAAARAKAEKDALARQKAIAAQQKTALLTQQKSIALQKLSNFLRQAQKVFDNEAITLAAAAQGKLSEEERARLKMKQDIYDLEQAINAGNVDAATKIAQTLYTDAQYLGMLREGILSLNGLPDPFEAWLATLNDILQLLKVDIPTASLTTQLYSAYGGTPPGYGSYGTTAGENGVLGPVPITPSPDANALRWQAMGNYYTGQPSPTAVNISIDPAVAGLINVIQDSSASGVSPTVSRINSSYIA